MRLGYITSKNNDCKLFANKLFFKFTWLFSLYTLYCVFKMNILEKSFSKSLAHFI